MAQTAQASTFNIVVNFVEGLSVAQQSIFTQAETYWESVVTGYQTGITIPALNIAASGVVIDGVGGILGSAGPTLGTLQGGYLLPTAGVMQFDSADLGALEVEGSLLAVIMHEMAHVMGFGTTWDLNGVYVNNSGRYTGANGLAAYRAEFDPLATFVPVDIISGPGTANSHWSEAWAGGQTELMTGFLNTPTFVSNTTIQSFNDIGYSTAVAAVPVPAGLGLLLIGLGALGAVRQRRRSA